MSKLIRYKNKFTKCQLKNSAYQFTFTATNYPIWMKNGRDRFSGAEQFQEEKSDEMYLKSREMLVYTQQPFKDSSL